MLVLEQGPVFATRHRYTPLLSTEYIHINIDQCTIVHMYSVHCTVEGGKHAGPGAGPRVYNATPVHRFSSVC